MYQIEISHKGLNKYRLIKGSDKAIVEQKARAQQASWKEMWDKQVEKRNLSLHRNNQKALAAWRTDAASSQIAMCTQLLSDALQANSEVNFSNLKSTEVFDEPRPQLRFQHILPTEPTISDPECSPSLNVLDKIFRSRGIRKENAARSTLENLHLDWEEECDNLRKKWSADVSSLEKEVVNWEQRKARF